MFNCGDLTLPRRVSWLKQTAVKTLSSFDTIESCQNQNFLKTLDVCI